MSVCSRKSTESLSLTLERESLMPGLRKMNSIVVMSRQDFCCLFPVLRLLAGGRCEKGVLHVHSRACLIPFASLVSRKYRLVLPSHSQ